MPEGSHNGRMLDHLHFLTSLADAYRPLKEARKRTHDEPNGAFPLERATIEYIRTMREVAKSPRNDAGIAQITDQQLAQMDELRADFITVVEHTRRPGFLRPGYEKRVYDAVREAVSNEQQRMQEEAQLSSRKPTLN